MADELNTASFRKQLTKIMPGYKWTVRRPIKGSKSLRAIGIRSSGFNRLSTLMVEKIRIHGDIFMYQVQSSGFGTHAPWLAQTKADTIARALRDLQDIYTRRANEFSAAATSLQIGRKVEGQ